jgi:hypothetical protein
MTHYSTDTRLLTWASTPWNRRRLVQVSPVVRPVLRARSPGILSRLIDWIGVRRHSAISLLKGRNLKWRNCSEDRDVSTGGEVSQGPKGRSHGSNGGCSLCCGAHFEIGAVSIGQECL